MKGRKRIKGISRIDQKEKRTHGFFVRLCRRGKIYNGFFADKTYGGKQTALKAAQQYYGELQRKHKPMTRKLWAQIPRRKGRSGLVGVQRVVVRRPGYNQIYWKATWSPRRHLVRRKMFSVQKYGAKKAKALAVRARNSGLRNMAE
ncbi:MAG TPA: hypothetical protein VKA67_09955 [Verrucomicrobiae bacterium]|nr:hypothetical protein [Verrucomicrobiae bacterium]